MFRVALVFAGILASLLSSCGEPERLEKGAILVEVERIAASKPVTPQEARPYDEGLAWHKYKVKQVLGGSLDASTIKVAHWTVVAGKAVPVSDAMGEVLKLKIVPFDSVAGLQGLKAHDDLHSDFSAGALEMPRFLDLSQTLAQLVPPTQFRYDYRGNVSEQMRLYWMLRGQLRAVVMGNSHAVKGVDSRAIMDRDNRTHPSMLNMAPAGANNDLECLMLREYVLPLPKLEWLLWVVSARNFNAKRVDTFKYDAFTSSPGWRYDQQHKSERWPIPEASHLLTTEEVKQNMGPMTFDPWGSLMVKRSELPADPAELKKAIQDQCHSTRFSFSDDLFSKFCETAREFANRGVKVLILTTPLHPFTNETPACDPDGTSHEGFREVVRHMEAFDQATPHLWFRDFHKDGSHDFPPGEFYDVDHLNRQGAGHLAVLIQEVMRQCDADEAAGGATAK